MTIIIGCVSQKGGVGKSTLARMIAREFANADWKVLIADMDKKQGTSVDWARRRNEGDVTPEVAAQVVKNVRSVPTASYDLVVFDGAPSSSADTREIAEASNLIILPTGVSMDDLKPTVLLARELEGNGVDRGKMAFALCRSGSEAESIAARDYITLAGYVCLEGDLPERIGYRDAQNIGRAVTETRHATLNTRADILAQAIADRVNAL